MLARHLDRRVAHERRPAGHHLEEDGPEGVHVAAGVGTLPLELLGREVRGRAEQDAWLGVDCRIGRLGDAEVGDFGAGRGQQHVGRLHVPMDDALGVGVRQGAGDAGPDLGRPLGVEGPFGPRDLAQGRPVHPLHDDVGIAGVVAPPTPRWDG